MYIRVDKQSVDGLVFFIPRFLIRLVLVGAILFSSIACDKEKSEAKARIHVLDDNNVAVDGVSVLFYVKGDTLHKNAINTIHVTNSDGYVELVRQWDCIIDVFAKKVVDNTALTGSTTIWMKQDSLTVDTIIVR